MKKLLSILLLYIISVSGVFACGGFFEGHETIIVDGKEMKALHGCDVNLIDYIIPGMKFIVIIIALVFLIRTILLIRKNFPIKTQEKNVDIQKAILNNAIIPLSILGIVYFIIKWLLIWLFGSNY